MDVATFLRLLRIDSRRPASWLALGIAAAAQAWLLAMPDANHALLPAAVAAGALAAVAAGGDPPRDDMLGGRLTRACWCGRALWPIGGVLLAAAVCGAVIDRPADGSRLVVVAMIAGIAATAAIATIAGPAASAADAASLALVSAAVSAAAGFAAARSGLGHPLVAGGVVWLGGAVVLLVVGMPGAGDALGPATDTGMRAATFAGIALGRGMRAALSRVAMATCLAGMAAWFFLAPERAWCYPLLAAAWFVSLAMPQALLQPGQGWNEVARTAAVTADRGETPALWRRPGSARWGWESAVTHAAVLGWPGIVAAVLWAASAPTTAGFQWPALTVGMLAAAAATLGLLASIGAATRSSGETMQAVAAGFACAGLLAILPLLP